MQRDKKHIIREVAKETNFTYGEAYRIIMEFVRQINLALLDGATVEIRSWGKWRVAIRKARSGRNPKSGKLISIPAYQTVKFKPSKILRLLFTKRPGETPAQRRAKIVLLNMKKPWAGRSAKPFPASLQKAIKEQRQGRAEPVS